jgi:hypothetical protein
MPTPKKAPTAPALLYPAHGCPPLGTFTEDEIEAQMRQRRQFIREHWNQPSVKSIIEMLEMRAARLTRRAIEPEATVHEQGQAYALTDFLSTLTQIPATSEIA